MPPKDTIGLGAARQRHGNGTLAVMSQLIAFVPLLVIFVGFMFFASRRQKRAVQASVNLRESLEVGDRVQTASGMQARIVGIAEDTVDLEIAPGVVTTWTKPAVRERIEPEAVEIDADDTDDAAGHGDLTAADPERLPKD